MDAAVSAVKQKRYADREKLTILVNNNHQQEVCLSEWLYPCQHVRCFSVYKDSTLGKKLVQRNTNHKWRHIHVHDECMKTLTTVVLFQLNLYTAYIFHTGVKGERKAARRDQSVSNSFHFSLLSRAASANQNVTAPHCGTYWYYIFNPPQYREQLQFNMHGSCRKVSTAID